MVAVGEVGLPYYLHAEKKDKGGVFSTIHRIIKANDLAIG